MSFLWHLVRCCHLLERKSSDFILRLQEHKSVVSQYLIQITQKNIFNIHKSGWLPSRKTLLLPHYKLYLFIQKEKQGEILAIIFELENSMAIKIQNYFTLVKIRTMIFLARESSKYVWKIKYISSILFCVICEIHFRSLRFCTLSCKPIKFS